MSKMQKHIHESNLIEGYDDPEFDKQSMVAWEFLAKQEKIDRAVVCEVQRLIVNPQTDLSASERGNYRYVTVYVGDYTTPNSMRIPELMESWLNNMAFFFDHTPKELHIEFERIHPFIDGNGRTGRMLMWWHEIKLGQKPTLIRNATKQRYYEWFKATDVSSSESSGEPPTLRKLAPVSPNTNIDELDRVLKSLKVVFPRTTSAETSDTNVIAWALIDALEAIKPVKKTEKYIYQIIVTSIDKLPIYTSKLELELTEPTANKLSEAISALVKYIQTPYEIGPELTSKTELLDKADEARDAFLESQ